MEDVRQFKIDAQDNQPHHLCVLVHGLWGNPQHLAFVAGELRRKNPAPHLHILVAKSNSGNFTYDGIELGGERLTREIEDEIESLANAGMPVSRFSLVGYSLGGLVGRYAIGLLYSKRVFDQMKPINFTTFATPHLGARTHRLGFLSRVFNEIGSRTLSTSGRQLFVTDSFRETGRPLLVILADRNSIFMRGLASFRRRTLYANIINDRSVPYYTAAASRVDPFVDLDSIQMNHLKGYDDVVLDPQDPISSAEPDKSSRGLKRWVTNGRSMVEKLPVAVLIGLLLPVGLVAYLVNSGVQSVRSNRRILLHEQGKAGIGIGAYHMPLIVEEMQSAVEGAIQAAHPGLPSHRGQDGEMSGEAKASDKDQQPVSDCSSTLAPRESPNLVVHGHGRPGANQPNQFSSVTLTPAQSIIVDALEGLHFRKYAVHIHRHRHTHAAIVVRTPKKEFEEGKTVIRHWVENEFDV